VDVEHFQPRGVPEHPDRMVFTGLLDYRPNYDGISWFLDEVFPLIRSRRPTAHVHVVGHGTPEVLSSLSRPGVHVTGRVPDLRDELEAAAVALVPLRIGGGTRLKIVEAMAMGRPIVSTTLGAEGIDAHQGEELLLADDPEAFAEATCQLLADPASRSLMGTRARALAADRYSWSRSTRELIALIDQVLSAGDSVHAR
jgi:glycosyltransferase involved in cell wall biosynthesis